MTEVTITTDSEANQLAQEQEIENPEDILEEQNEEQTEPTDEAQPDIDHQNILRQAKLAHLVEAYLPEGSDVESELQHVGGLEVSEDGTVTGTPVYRKPQVANKSTKQTTKKTAPRTPATPTAPSWDTRRAGIVEAKRKAGIYH